EIAPSVTRVAVLREAGSVTGPAQFGAIQAVAPTLGVELRPVDARDVDQIDHAITAFARNSNGGMIVTGSPAATVYRKEIVALAARHRLPGVYYTRYFAAEGGLISYGPEFSRPIPPCGRLRRSYPQGREADRSAGAGADQVRNCAQPQDCEGTRPRRADNGACPRRRGDRVKGFCCMPCKETRTRVRASCGLRMAGCYQQIPWGPLRTLTLRADYAKRVLETGQNRRQSSTR